MSWRDIFQEALLPDNIPPEDRPTMALMTLSMIAGLRKESEEEALQWLMANPLAENWGFGWWLLRLEES